MLGTIQHQEKFYFWQLEALLHTTYSIKKGMYLTTDIGINIDILLVIRLLQMSINKLKVCIWKTVDL